MLIKPVAGDGAKSHIDADGIVYEIGFLKDENGEGLSLAATLRAVKKRMNDILEATEAESFQAYLTGGNNFRDKIATIQPYKGERDRDSRPEHFDNIREYLVNYWDAVVVDGMEADDALSIAIWEDFRANGNDDWASFKYAAKSIICSRDKDLNNVAGWHYSWAVGKSKEKPVHWISKEEADYHFYKQLLTGDKIDNIKGLSGTKAEPGIGPKAAEKILKDCSDVYSYYSTVRDQYILKYEEKADEYLVENARLLWMLTHPKDVWRPPVEET
jgi:hypothetical protein